MPADGVAAANSQSGYLRLLVEALLERPGMQRAEIARRVGLPRHAVSDLLAELEIRSMVRVTGALDGLPGRSQQSYALQTQGALALGFDIGGNKLAGALTDMSGAILAEMAQPTDHNGTAGLIAQITQMAGALCHEAVVDLRHVRHVAVGLPAAIDPISGMASMAGNLAGLEGQSLRDALSESLGCPVHLDNDVNLALIAEVSRGSAQTEHNVAFVALGTGIGSAMLVNGHLLRGAHGGAGEIGYLPLWQLEPAGVPSLENQVGEAGIRKSYVDAGGPAQSSVRDIFDAAAAGETAATSALDLAARSVARGIIAVLSLVDPSIVVLGGSIGARPEFIERVARHVTPAWSRPIEIRRSHAGGRSGVIGALELSRQAMLERLFGPLPQG